MLNVNINVGTLDSEQSDECILRYYINYKSVDSIIFESMAKINSLLDFRG